MTLRAHHASVCCQQKPSNAAINSRTFRRKFYCTARKNPSSRHTYSFHVPGLADRLETIVSWRISSKALDLASAVSSKQPTRKLSNPTASIITRIAVSALQPMAQHPAPWMGALLFHSVKEGLGTTTGKSAWCRVFFGAIFPSTDKLIHYLRQQYIIHIYIYPCLSMPRHHCYKLRL